ncbi:MAG: cytochrome c [Acetobacteraceae bacterium]
MGMITSRYLGGTEIEGVEAPDISPAGLARLGFDREGSRYLGGTEIEGVEAPDISPAGLARLGFDREGLTAYLRIGAGPQGVMNFSMYDVLHNSTRHLAEADLAAMAGYLTSSAPTATIATAQAGIGANAKAGGSSSWPGLSQPSTSSLAGGAKDVAPIAGHAAATAIPDPRSAPGRWLYVAVCAGCHGIDGEGVPHTAPPMRGNASLRLASPRNMLVAVTMGLEERDLGGGEAMQAMPGFTGLLDDRQIADLANYLRIAWGGTAGDVTAETVRQARDAVR